MSVLHDLVADLSTGSGNRLSLPEYRQIELYSKKKSLTFADAKPASEVPVPAISGACRSFLVLDALLGESAASLWQKYLSLPRTTMTGKLVAELYRILRVVREVAFHPHGHIEVQDGIIKINGAINKVALSLEITASGLTLLESAAAYYLDSLRQPYPDAYVAAMLSQYFTDIVGEVKRFADEDRVLYQYRQKRPFNRHFRFDCDNPKLALADGRYEFEIGPIHQDSARTPIDFFVTIDDALHIIPVEALEDGSLPLEQLEQWRARTTDGTTLAAHFRSRFAREVMVVGQPMT